MKVELGFVNAWPEGRAERDAADQCEWYLGLLTPTPDQEWKALFEGLPGASDYEIDGPNCTFRTESRSVDHMRENLRRLLALANTLDTR
jgi:hypothetical protein